MRNERYDHFSWVVKTFRTRYKAPYNHTRRKWGKNKTSGHDAHQSWSLGSNCCWALCVSGPNPALGGNNCGPPFQATNKLLEACSSSLGLCCDFYLSRKTFRVLFLKYILNMWSPIEYARPNFTRTHVRPGNGWWPVREAGCTHDVLEWADGGLL